MNRKQYEAFRRMYRNNGLAFATRNFPGIVLPESIKALRVLILEKRDMLAYHPGKCAVKSVRSEFRSNVKAHRFVMSPGTPLNRAQRSSLASRLFWVGFGLLALLGAAAAVSFIGGAALSMIGG